jgi:REP element-mobilizing transposase RayT
MSSKQSHSADLRKGRYSQTGHYYFLTTSIAFRRPILTVPYRAEIVLSAIRWLNSEDHFKVDAAVVMPDHLHIAGQLREKALAGIMHSLKSFTANRLSATGVRAPVWQDGYHDHGLRHDEDYRTKVRYVLENPVRAGLVERAEDYAYLILPEWWVSPVDHP